MPTPPVTQYSVCLSVVALKLITGFLTYKFLCFSFISFWFHPLVTCVRQTKLASSQSAFWCMLLFLSFDLNCTKIVSVQLKNIQSTESLKQYQTDVVICMGRLDKNQLEY